MAVEDGSFDSNKIKIEIEKTGPTERQLDGITVNHTFVDKGKKGRILVLQLVSSGKYSCCHKMRITHVSRMNLFHMELKPINIHL